MKEYVSNGYIICVGDDNGYGGVEISDERYNAILSALQHKPQVTEAINYRLKIDLTWESYEAESTPNEEPNPTDEERLEAYEILMGVK